MGCRSYEQGFLKERVSRAFRTGWACLMVGIVMKYTRNWMPFPVFSYVMAVCVVAESCLGETLKTACNAFVGVIVGAVPALLNLNCFVGPAHFSLWVTTLSVTLTSFLIGYPKSVDITSKRVACAETIIIYSSAFLMREAVDPLVYPLRVATTISIGTICAVLSLVIPFPRLAYAEVKRKRNVVVSIITESLELLVRAFSCDDPCTANALTLHAHSLLTCADRMLKSMKDNLVGMHWETVGSYRRSDYYKDNDLKTIKRYLLGMELLLRNPSHENGLKEFMIEPLENLAQCALEALQHQLEKPNKPSESTLLLEKCKDAERKLHQSILKGTKATHQNSTRLFFSFLSHLILKDTINTLYPLNNETRPPVTPISVITLPIPETPAKPKSQHSFFRRLLNGLCESISSDKKRLLMASKSAVALGSSIFLGFLLDREHGFWAGLAVSISLNMSRERTFRLANVRAQGTVAGSVYGVIVLLITRHVLCYRALGLIPWVIFSSFLRQTNAYGYAGGASAFMAAVIIMGKKHRDPPAEFAIVRITETFIGMLCLVLTELIFQPTRAATLATTNVISCLQNYENCLDSLSVDTNPQVLHSSEEKLKTQIRKLGSSIEEAKEEPDLWFHPFSAATYTEILHSTTRLAEYFHFIKRALEVTANLCYMDQILRVSIWQPFEEEIREFSEKLSTCFHCLAWVLETRVLGKVKKATKDVKDSELDRNGVKRGLQRVRNALENVAEDEVKSVVMMCVGACCFCMDNILREMGALQRLVMELLQWENPWESHNLWDIYYSSTIP